MINFILKAEHKEVFELLSDEQVRLLINSFFEEKPVIKDELVKYFFSKLSVDSSDSSDIKNKKKNLFLEMYRTNKNINRTHVAVELGVSRNCVQNWIKSSLR